MNIDDTITQLWNSGKLVREIAEAVGRSEACVQERARRLRRRGVYLKPRRPTLIRATAASTRVRFPTPEEIASRRLDVDAIASALAGSRVH